MCTHESDDKSIPSQIDSYYEEQASQEEIYLEESEEELRLVLESDDLPSPEGENLDAQREEATEELIVRDGDDPPLSEVAIGDLLRMTVSETQG